ncbi:MAG: hypothetical protein U9N57_00260 [Pseudomonadota bacterium]|nr:hypothetical protein [Pseudomonadota bacterium]
MTLKFIAIRFLGLPSYRGQASGQNNRVVLLNAIEGSYTPSNPKPVKLLITPVTAKDRIAEGNAFPNKKRLRYEFNINANKLHKNEHKPLLAT